ncbi:zinc phosphodiesterase ELAC protein 1-like [Lytechinus variegatus]|uniref:zinc phosphodiesterase ELAC protein 1-like n=1 Tax=Lytechinus variegatus TaxID=7654 RepID=UPI001BB0F8C7|nr:zinc phosphodiesterase ELAC protein 1-like [Lytechinus variegatus]
MDITFLGTASAHPSPTRGVSGTVVKSDGEAWLVDCGEGTQIQLMKSSVKPGRITKIFITHLHGDHSFGLPGLLCTLNTAFLDPDREGSIMEIYGPQGLRKYVRVSLELSRSEMSYSYVVHELQVPDTDHPHDWESWKPSHEAEGSLHPNEKAGRNITMNADGIYNLHEDDRHIIQAAPLTHRVPCFGYVFLEKPQPGRLDAEMLRSRGIPPGPLYARIKAGQEIEAPDGSVITPQDVVGPTRPGRKIVILGDTKESSRIIPIAMNADVLVHEATVADELHDICIERGHSTPAMAGQFAAQIQCKHLVISHFSQRYSPLSRQCKEGDETVQKLLDQTRATFPGGKVTAAEDLMTISVPARK